MTQRDLTVPVCNQLFFLFLIGTFRSAMIYFNVIPKSHSTFTAMIN